MSNGQPVMMDLEPGIYYWCSCGKSSKGQFCDGSHKGTDMQPIQFEVKEKKKCAVCSCKRTNNPPFCDGAHLKR